MTTSVQPVTFYVPASAADPIEIKVAHSGLRMILVHRNAIGRLGEEWRVLGVYFLLGPDPAEPERFWAYVGEVGKRTLLLRLGEHAADKAWWNRALLVTSADQDGFNSAEIGWLEGRFYDVLNNAVAATVKNKGRPGDDSIPLKDRSVLERYVEPTIAALRAVGAPPDTADQLPAPSVPGKKAHYPGSVSDLLASGLLKAGTRLNPMRGHSERTALVREDGSLEVDGNRYDSLSSAAQAVTGNKAEAGWDFWGAPSGDGRFVRMHELRMRLEPSSVARAAQPTTAALQEPRVVVKPSIAKKRHYGVSIRDLLDAGLLATGATLRPTRSSLTDTIATVTSAGEIDVAGQVFSSPTKAAVAVSKNVAEPGWDFWAAEIGGRRRTLHQLREELLAERTKPDGKGPAT